MKKAHVVGVAMFAVLLFGVMSVASASAATLQWLEDALPIGTASNNDAEGEITLTNLKTAIGTKAAVLCSGIFVGSVGPGSQDVITEVLDLAEKPITLTARITCTNIEGCPKPELSPENLPWLTVLELMGTEAEPLFLDKILNGGKGEPGYTVHCEVIGFPFEETCLGVASSKLINDPSERDVLSIFEPGEETGICGNETTATAEVSTGTGDAEGLILLLNGLELAVSYE
jgi:hypothetical protein